MNAKFTAKRNTANEYKSMHETHSIPKTKIKRTGEPINFDKKLRTSDLLTTLGLEDK
jgi:hypothetical protein